MLQKFLTRFFGSRNDRLLRDSRRVVERVNALEAQLQPLDDQALAARTADFRQRVANGESLDALLPEAFATCREASRRVLGMRHFDVQLIGGMTLHAGRIAEMRTGEGKTLMATLPAYLNALAGRGVHVVTVNDYLAARDAQWMGRVYGFLGLSYGVNLSQMPHGEKQQAYASDITYGTNNEFGFDYLRDNMVYGLVDRVQRGLHFAIVDEVDSILIDEARTPLIISGQADDHTELYQRMNAVPPLLSPMATEPRTDEPEPEGDYWVDRKAHQVHISEAGHEKAERILSEIGLLPAGASLYDASNILLMHHLMAALRAHTLFFRDQQYVVQNDEVVIVDEFTGRLMTGRRWSDGLHQAVEAKEGARIQPENQTLASITFQNYFRMYGKLGGMTGTADTEAYEFQEIYNLETVVIPTHRPMVRIDRQDQVFRTAKEKYNAILEDIRDCHQRGQPVLVGTTSIENSELLAEMLVKATLPHNVLNAKQHAREAEIVAEAGRPGAITIATNMAGRGTDIVLGGGIDKAIDQLRQNPDLTEVQQQTQVQALRSEWQVRHDAVLTAGGLHIVGTERHESRRIDNQLRGRSGRQGDAGSSRFYLSMDDPLLKIFAGERLQSIMERLRLPEGEAIESGLVSRSIESAQRKVEARNFDIRKQLLEYDDVANEQRKVIYQQRNELLEAADVDALLAGLRQGVFEDLFRRYVPAESVEEQWDLKGLEQTLLDQWQMDVPLSSIQDASDIDLQDRLLSAADTTYRAKAEMVGADGWASFTRSVMLQSIDTHWREHLAALDHLRQGIHLRGYAQKNPKQEYKREAFELFESMLTTIRDEVTGMLMTVRIAPAEMAEIEAPAVEPTALPEAETAQVNVQYMQAAFEAQGPVVERVGRNDACPCGSGKKYKHCHGKLN
jgi:preprotein translocase subunit SecA